MKEWDMNPKYTHIILICLVLGLAACTEIKDLFNPPGPREIYERKFEENNPALLKWKAAFEESLEDSLNIDLPYGEAGYFHSDQMVVYAYEVELRQGEIFICELKTADTTAKIFIDFYRLMDDSVRTYEFVKRNEPENRRFKFEVEESGLYRIILQSAIDVQTPFAVTVYTLPSYGFPVAGKDNDAIKSFWGAEREAGRRVHEGIDIFAERGRPVLAAVDGRITYTGEKGLGGNQVWLRTKLLGGKSLYYAHLDSISVSSIEKVERGDTLGFVGNSGNARTTNPHLHFGIYGRGGAVDPLPFVFKRVPPQPSEFLDLDEKRQLIVTSTVANLRDAPSIEGDVITEAKQGDTLRYLGHAGDWRHVLTSEEIRAFVHESLVE